MIRKEISKAFINEMWWKLRNMYEELSQCSMKDCLSSYELKTITRVKNVFSKIVDKVGEAVDCLSELEWEDVDDALSILRMLNER